jgi:hypothetical protein
MSYFETGEACSKEVAKDVGVSRLLYRSLSSSLPFQAAFRRANVSKRPDHSLKLILGTTMPGAGLVGDEAGGRSRPIPMALTDSHDQPKGWMARRLSVDL